MCQVLQMQKRPFIHSFFFLSSDKYLSEKLLEGLSTDVTS